MLCYWSALLVICITAAASVEDTKGPEKLIFAKDLPSDPFTFENVEKIRHDLVDYQKGNPLSFEVSSILDEMENVQRERRAIDIPYNDAYCCNQPMSTQVIFDTLVVMKTRKDMINAGGKIKCGFLGLKRCHSNRQVSIINTFYAKEQQQRTVPASKWVNGCPETQIVCCPENQEFKKRCYKQTEVENMFKLQRMYPDFDFTMTILGIPFNPDLKYVTQTEDQPTIG